MGGKVRWRSRTFTGAGFAAAAAAGALTLSGCSSHSDDQGKKEPTQSATASGAGPSAPPSTTGAASASASPTAAGANQGLGGVWLAMEGTTKVQLVLGKGKAALTSASLCGGTYTEHNGIGLILTCMDGNNDRTAGHGDLSRDGKTLTVTWSGGITDTFTRTGLPSS
jgi:hypothetical protein